MTGLGLVCFSILSKVGLLALDEPIPFAVGVLHLAEDAPDQPDQVRADYEVDGREGDVGSPRPFSDLVCLAVRVDRPLA